MLCPNSDEILSTLPLCAVLLAAESDLWVAAALAIVPSKDSREVLIGAIALGDVALASTGIILQ